MENRILLQCATVGPLGGLSLAGTLGSDRGVSASPMRVLGCYGVVYLESGGGAYRDANGLRKPVRSGDASTNNLFGIKAGASWRGAVAAASTTEYEHGAMLRKTERFRAYPDTASAFRDYADLLTSNPRYQGALNTGSDARAFASGLAQGGYATDPHYADKLSKVAAQLQRSGALAAITP